MTHLDMKSIRSTASCNRRAIFRTLLGLPHDDKYLGYLVTRKAKDLGLVDEERKNLKGNTVVEWAESSETDGRNTPNAWACTAAIHVILDYSRKFTLSEEEITAFAYYFNQDCVEIDAFFQAKALVTNSLVGAN